MSRALNIIAFLVFASTIFIRSLDPLIPQIAGDFAVEVATATLVATAFSLPYAFIQPVLGSLADMLGKTRLILTCMSLLVLASVVGALAWTFPVLASTRVVAGIAAGGIFPIALAVVGDLAPVEQRQVAISRLLAASMSGNILGSALSGIVGDLVSWRAVLAAMAALAFVSVVTAFVGLRGRIAEPAPRFDPSSAWEGYRAIFANPLAKFCFGAVFVEGIFLQGLFPHIAPLLHQQGETRAAIAGFVIAGFGVGGLAYTFAVAWMLPRLGERRLMSLGGAFMALGLFSIALQAPWPVDFAIFVLLGFSFYMLHGIIQVYVTELAPKARGASAALHSAAFFIGQALGPVVYSFGFPRIGLMPMMAVAAVSLVITGIVCAMTLRRRPAEF